jgi:cell division protein FtsN
LNNNRQVVVVVDGRISYNEGRLLDISKEAARNLDMLEGPAPVRMEILTASQAAASEDQPELAEQEPPGENELVPLPELAQTFEPESEAAFEPEPAAPPAAATPPPVITMEPAPMTPPPALPPSETPPPQPGRTRADAEASNMTIKLIVNINGKEQALNLSSQDASVEFDTLPCDIAAPQPAVSVKIIPAAPDPRSAGFYRLQVGAFASLSLAQGVYLRLKNAGFSPALELNGKFYRVVIAGVKAQDISATARRLGDAGFAEAWVRKER